jgi:hypothetical protein
MSGVNYRCTVIVRVGVGVRVGGWVRRVVEVPWPLLTYYLVMLGCHCDAFANGCRGLELGGFSFFRMCRGCGVLLSEGQAFFVNAILEDSF